MISHHSLSPGSAFKTGSFYGWNWIFLSGRSLSKEKPHRNQPKTFGKISDAVRPCLGGDPASGYLDYEIGLVIPGQVRVQYFSLTRNARQLPLPLIPWRAHVIQKEAVRKKTPLQQPTRVDE
jgi:hypothetical protein